MKRRKRKKRRPSKAELAQRVDEVLNMRLSGAEFYDLKAHATEKEWDVSDRQLWRYVAKSDALLAQSLERDRRKLLGRHLAQRRSLFARALNDGDLRTALAIAKDEAELQGLYHAPGWPADKDDFDAGQFTEAEAELIFTQLVARFGLKANTLAGNPVIFIPDNGRDPIPPGRAVVSSMPDEQPPPGNAANVEPWK